MRSGSRFEEQDLSTGLGDLLEDRIRLCLKLLRQNSELADQAKEVLRETRDLLASEEEVSPEDWSRRVYRLEQIARIIQKLTYVVDRSCSALDRISTIFGKSVDQQAPGGEGWEEYLRQS